MSSVSWAMRNHHENLDSEVSIFLLLTYAKTDGVLHYGHVQLFHKKLRRAGVTYRYHQCGEYGGLKGRPHYHCIMYMTQKSYEKLDLRYHSVDEDYTINYHSELIQQKWDRGMTSIRVNNGNLDTSFYISLYSSKNKSIKKKLWADFAKTIKLPRGINREVLKREKYMRDNNLIRYQKKGRMLSDAQIKAIDAFNSNWNKIREKMQSSLALGFQGFIRHSYEQWKKDRAIYVQGRAYQIPYPWLTKLVKKYECPIAKEILETLEQESVKITDEETMAMKKRDYEAKKDRSLNKYLKDLSKKGGLDEIL